MNILSDHARALAAQHGVEYCGGTSIEGLSLLPQGRHKLPQNASGVLVFLFPYYTGEMKGRNISRYAAVPDYHIAAMDILKDVCLGLSEQYPSNVFVPLVDSSPIPEVAAAAACGLGVIGRHGLLINERYGSYVFIGEIVTDIPLQPAGEIKTCAQCGLCQRSCPGGAIGGAFNKEKCLSHITQMKGELPEEYIKLIKKQGFVWGCDVCLEACSMNKTTLTPIKSFYEDIIINAQPDTLPRLMKHACGWRGEKVLNRNIKYIQE